MKCVGFSFSDDPQASLPPKARQAVITLSDIEKTMLAAELGAGQVLNDGSVLIEFQTFRITFHPDGSFNGRRTRMNGATPRMVSSETGQA